MGLKKLGSAQGFQAGILSSTLFGGIGKLLLFCSTLLATYYFGTTQQTDLVYFLQNTQVQVCGFILAINMSVVIPRGIHLQQQSRESTIAFYNSIFILYTIIGLAIFAIFAISPEGITSLFSKFPVDLLKENRLLLFFIPVALLLNFQFQLINDVFTSFKRFTLPALINTAFVVIIIATLILFHNSWKEPSYSIGILAGLSICLLLQFIFLKKIGWHFGIQPSLISGKTWSFIGYTQLGQVFTLVSSFLPLYLLSGQAGSLSAYNIAFQLISLPSVFAIGQFASVAGVKFAELHANHDRTGMNEVFKKSSLFLLFICFPVAGLLVLCSADLLQYLIPFSQSKQLSLAISFTSILALTIPMAVVNTLMARLLMASQNIKIGFYNQVIQNSLLIFLSFLLFDKFGAIGLAYAVLIMSVINISSSFIIAKKFLVGIDFIYVLRWLIILLLINGLIYLACFAIKDLFEHGVIMLIVSCSLYIILLIATALIIKPLSKIIKQPFLFLGSWKSGNPG